MSESTQEFIRKMQAKYGGMMNTPVFPPSRNGTIMPQMNNLVRFTGNGNDGITQESKEVEGVSIHEGEMIVEEDLVTEMGGPEKTRAEIEGIAKKKKEGFQEGTGNQTVGGALNIPSEAAPASPANMGRITRTMLPRAVEQAPTPPGTPVEASPTLPSNTGQITRTMLPKAVEPAPTPPMTPVEAAPTPPADMGKITRTMFDATPAPRKVKKKPLIKEPPVETPPVVEAPPEPVTPPTPFETAQTTGLEGLKRIAAGESDVARIERERAESSLSGIHAAEDMAQRQQLAQMDASPEVAAAAGARQNRAQRLERAGMQADLALGAAQRAETAIDRLATLGMEGMFREKDFLQNEKLIDAQIQNMENMNEIDWAKVDLSREELAQRNEQFRENLELDWAKYGLDEKQIDAMIGIDRDRLALDLKKFGLDEQQVNAMIGLDRDRLALELEKFGLTQEQVQSAIRQEDDRIILAQEQFAQNVTEFGLEYALREKETDWNINSLLFNTMLQAGDFENASRLMDDKYGINMDFGQITDANQREQAGLAVSDLITRIDLLGPANATMDDTEVQAALKSGWEAISDQPFDSAEGQKWANDTFTATKLSMDPINSALSGFTEESLENMVMAAGWENIDDFKFAGQTGVDAMRLVLTEAASPGGGMIMNDDGTMTVNPTGALGMFMQGPGGVTKEGPEDTSGDKETIQATLIAGNTPSATLVKETAPIMTQDSIPTGEEAFAYKDGNNGGYVVVNDTPMKLIDGLGKGTYGNLGGSAIFEDMQGNTYTYVKGEDKWYKGRLAIANKNFGPAETRESYYIDWPHYEETGQVKRVEPSELKSWIDVNKKPEDMTDEEFAAAQRERDRIRDEIQGG